MARKKVTPSKLLRSRTRTNLRPIASSLKANKSRWKGKKRSTPHHETGDQTAGLEQPRSIASPRSHESGFGKIIPQISRNATHAISQLKRATKQGGASARNVVAAAIPPLKNRVNEGYKATKKVAVGIGHGVAETASRLATKTAKVSSEVTAKTRETVASAVPPITQRVADGYRATKKAAIDVGHEVRDTTSRVANKVARVVRDGTSSQRAAESQKNLEEQIRKQVDDAVALRVEPAVTQCVASLEERVASGLKGQISKCVREELEPLVARQFASAEGRLSRDLDMRVKAAGDRIANALTQRLTASLDQKLESAVTKRIAAAEARAAGN